jgi:hypothetical protein
VSFVQALSPDVLGTSERGAAAGVGTPGGVRGASAAGEADTAGLALRAGSAGGGAAWTVGWGDGDAVLTGGCPEGAAGAMASAVAACDAGAGARD